MKAKEKKKQRCERLRPGLVWLQFNKTLLMSLILALVPPDNVIAVHRIPTDAYSCVNLSNLMLLKREFCWYSVCTVNKRIWISQPNPSGLFLSGPMWDHVWVGGWVLFFFIDMWSSGQTGGEVDRNPYTIQRNVPKVHRNSNPSLVLLLAPPPLLPLSPSLPSSLLRFFYEPTSTVSPPGITLQSTEESSNCIRRWEWFAFCSLSDLSLAGILDWVTLTAFLGVPWNIRYSTD